MIVVDDAADASTDRDPTLGPAKACHSSYAVTGRFDGVTRLELVPHTGRLHQLRAHCAALGHPILGDNLYGRPSGANDRATRLCLHAAKLTFVDPDTTHTFVVTSDFGWGLGDVPELRDTAAS